MAEKIRQKVKLQADPYNQYGCLLLHPKCNGFTIKNFGTTNVVFMQDVLTPGMSKAYGGNQDEVYEVNEEINFQVPVPAPGVITNGALVTQKFFVD